MGAYALDQIFLRNFVVFLIVLLSCTFSLIYVLYSGHNSLDATDTLVEETQAVLTEAEQLSKLTEGMLAAQRGYILTGDDSFWAQYQAKKSGVSERIATLYSITQKDLKQQSRIEEIRQYFVEFSNAIEERASQLTPLVDPEFLDDVDYINGLRDNIFRINNVILHNEYSRLENRLADVDSQKDEYFQILITAIIVGTLLIILFNGFLLKAQRKRSLAETSLQSSEERFVLAVSGMQDGIFDWDIKSGEVFYSKQYFRMLGYDRDETGTLDDFKELLHPDDQDRVWDYVDTYLAGELSEFELDFRLKHSSGRWVWVKARAKAVFDKKGQATRLVGAHTDITALKQKQQVLAMEKRAAEEKNQAKSEFLAHMSHEIRTPLNAITGIGEILSRQAVEFDDKQKHLIKTLNSSANALKELITDILDFSKIESGEIELEDDFFRLDTVFEETISMMALKANEKGISFVFDYGTIKDDEFFGDKVRIRQILVNLIGNAIKFTDEGGVTIQCHFEDRDSMEFLRVDVSDTGIGISPDNFHLVFERFRQADSSVSRKYGGTGLGLPISKQLAKIMGGDIFLSSALGEGSTFSLLLPLRKHMRAAGTETTRHSDNKVQKQILADLKNDTKILVVEDYEGNLVVLGYILEEMGLAYDVAKNGVEAVDLWDAHHYDLILMDVQMPEMDGFSATSLIRNKEKQGSLDHTPIIGMTAHALVGDKDKCIAAGMDSYLPKPLVEADLKREILGFLVKYQEDAA